jgi:predicted dehydrogenase
MNIDNYLENIDPNDKNHANIVNKTSSYTRRSFIHSSGLGLMAIGLPQFGCSNKNKTIEKSTENIWLPISKKKIRLGIVGNGASKFGIQFGFQNHPNIEIVAVSDLFPERCLEMAKACKCSNTYSSLEELLKDRSIDAVFLATDAASHFRHSIDVLNHGKHLAVAVPAVLGSLEDAEILFAKVKSSGLTYMMFETSIFREDLYSMRQIYQAGGFGKLIYSEGEYFHYGTKSISSYNNWRVGLPPQFYPTHSNAYYVGVTDNTFTEVSCLGVPSLNDEIKSTNNIYKNPFGTEIALFKTSEGGSARMAVSWDTPGDSGERGRVRGQKGSFYEKYDGFEKSLPSLLRPALPPNMPLGSHGGSHANLIEEFINSILQNRKPLIDIAMALNLTVPGIVAHQSAMKNGELLKIPQYKIA